MVKKLQTPFVLTLLLAISGCELIGPQQRAKLPLTSAVQAEEDEQPDVVYQELSNEPAAKGAGEQVQTELYPGNGQFVGRPDGGAGDNKAEKGEYSLNFDDADLGEVAKVVLSDILGQNYLLSPKVGGKVTLQTTQPLTRAELLPTLEMLLQVNNAALTYQNGLYQIKPAAEVVTGSVFAGFGNSRKMASGHMVRVVPVRNVGVEDLAAIIKPLLDEKSILNIDGDRNIMLLAGTADELARALEMVGAFDVNIMRGKSFGLFPLRSVEAAKLIEELEQLFNSSKKGESSFFRFMEIERLNAILAITHNADYLKEIERWILRLDRANTSAGGGVIVYRAQHVDAVELATTLNDIFGKGGGSGKASVAAGRKTVEVTNKARTDDKPAPPTTLNRAPSLDNLGEVKIIPDEINNALIIVASAQDYTVIQRVIKQLDVMPLQVLIDATIVDVNLTDDLKYGIQWYFSHNNGGTNDISGGGDIFQSLASIAAGTVTGGFGYSFISKSQDIKAVLSAEALKKNVNVISSPSLMVLNNQEASIQVGNEISLRTSQNTPTNTNIDVNSTLISTSQLQQRKTGVKLKVKPRVNASGLVIMEIEQSVEDPGALKSDGSNPDILTREINSSVAVQSGETIVLGGLIKENNTNSRTGVPYLHELPIIGSLFGSTNNTKEKTELVVLITPRVIRGKQDARLVADEFKRKLTGIYQIPAEPAEQL